MKYIYVRCIKAGKITIDDVPSHWKQEVEDLLKQEQNNAG